MFYFLSVKCQKKTLPITDVPWFADYANYLVGGVIPYDFNYNKQKKIVHDCRLYF